MPELGTLGSVRGALSNERPYRDKGLLSRAPTTLRLRKAMRTVAIARGRSGPARSETLACAQAPRTGTERSLVHPGHAPPDRAGKARSRRRREKSDPAIVALKPTNAAQRCGWEPVEPRAGAEGKAIQQSAFRTQGRADASQALERLRQAARRNGKVKFTALLHHIGIACLETAFLESKKDAAAGIDGVTWRDYEADLERNLADLQPGSRAGRTGRRRAGGSTSPSRTAGDARWRLRRLAHKAPHAAWVGNVSFKWFDLATQSRRCWSVSSSMVIA